jgi:hypothetical protein
MVTILGCQAILETLLTGEVESIAVPLASHPKPTLTEDADQEEGGQTF